jgi:hypothetical protein
MKWYSELISDKYNSVGANQKKRGRKPVNEVIVREILRLAESNLSWGYDRITGVMKYLGYDVSATTVRNILDAHGIVPDPERRRRGDWLQFIETQQYVTAATDFAHVEMATEYGLERRHLLFFMDIGSREVRCGGIAHDPDVTGQRKLQGICVTCGMVSCWANAILFTTAILCSINALI